MKDESSQAERFSCIVLATQGVKIEILVDFEGPKLRSIFLSVTALSYTLEVTSMRLFRLPITTCLAALFLLPASLGAQQVIKPNSTEQTSFDVIGIQTRTNNAKEASGNGQIGNLWQRLFQEGALNQITGRADEFITVVYTDYASDWNGDYTYTLGTKVKPGTKPPDGMVAVTVQPGKYLEFVSEIGQRQQVAPEAWKKIWTYFQNPSSPQRAYKTDFERYAPTDPADVQAHIFLGVKP
jgi:predicted transcriptional regulator YdeE